MEWQALDATLALEYAAWAAVAVVKFVVTPSLMMAIGHPWWVAWAVTAAGAAGGVWVVWHSGKRLFSWFEERLGSREGRGKRTFTPGRRRIVWLKNHFGLHGLLAVSGLISVPIATTLAAKYFRHHPWVMQRLMLALPCGRWPWLPSHGWSKTHTFHDPCPLFFDLDHTLWDFETNSRLALEQGFKDLELASLGVADLPTWIRHTRRPTTIVGPNSGQAEWTKPPCGADALNWPWRLVEGMPGGFPSRLGSTTWPTARTKRPSSQARWRCLRPCVRAATDVGVDQRVRRGAAFEDGQLQPDAVFQRRLHQRRVGGQKAQPASVPPAANTRG